MKILLLQNDEECPVGYVCSKDGAGNCIPFGCQKDEDCSDPTNPQQKFECSKTGGFPTCVPVIDNECTDTVILKII
jgi:hypothetical protein